MPILVLITLLLFLTFFIAKYTTNQSLSRKDVLIGWGIKIGFSALYLYIFKHYYGNGFLYGDSSRFMQDSRVLADIAYTYPWEYIKILFGFADETSKELWPFIQNTQIWMYGDNGDFINDNRLILRINSIVHFISFGSVYVHTLVHVFISFMGIRLIYYGFKNFVANKKWFWYGLVLLPSLSFWGGGILKESVLIFGLGVFVFSLKHLTQQWSIKYGIVFFVGIGVLLFNKPYVGLCVVPVSLLWFLAKRVEYKLKYIWLSLVFILVVFIGLLFAPAKINLTEKVSYKQKDLTNMGHGGIFFITDSSFCSFDYTYLNHFEMANDSLIKVIKTTPGEYKLFGEYTFHPFTIKNSEHLYAHYLTQVPSNSFYDTAPINNSNIQLIKSIPVSIWNVLVRPYPWDNGNGLKLFAFIQNIFLLGFLVFSIVRRKVINLQEKWAIYILIWSTCFVTLLIGWTTPIFGAAVRYKVPVDLFILIISFILLKSKSHEKV